MGRPVCSSGTEKRICISVCLSSGEVGNFFVY